MTARPRARGLGTLIGPRRETRHTSGASARRSAGRRDPLTFLADRGRQAPAAAACETTSGRRSVPSGVPISSSLLPTAGFLLPPFR